MPGEGCAWRGMCLEGGAWRGVLGEGCAWRGVPGGMCLEGGAWRGMCLEGCAWRGLLGEGCACPARPRAPPRHWPPCSKKPTPWLQTCTPPTTPHVWARSHRTARGPGSCSGRRHRARGSHRRDAPPPARRLSLGAARARLCGDRAGRHAVGQSAGGRGAASHTLTLCVAARQRARCLVQVLDRDIHWEG